MPAAVATGSPLQDSRILPDLSQRAAQPDAAELARKAHQAQQKRARRAAMSEQQADAVRAADASGHNKSRSVRHKVSPAVAGYSMFSMTVMAALFGSSAASSAANLATATASGLISPTTLPQAMHPCHHCQLTPI